jgi:sterol desaturase/sphingolipid hydroxylase (fatty acid hydroxylase superfamily)
MREFKIDNKGSGKLFNNRILEGLTRTHFAFPVILYYSIAFICLAAAGFLDVLGWNALYIFPLGMISFSLAEYLIHRYIFHFNAVSEKEKNLQYHIHGVHHEFPRDKDRLVMPPVLSVTLAIGFFFLFRLMMGNSGLIFYAGFVSGYSTYLVVHYLVDTRRPPNNFFKILWRHHSLHHYHSVETAFAVTFPVWDILFGTMPKLADKSVREKLPDSL